VRKALLLSAIAVTGLFGIDPAAHDVKTVYILKMANGLDQYLASELTTYGVYTVTTDPSKADAVFTDSLGEGFEKKFTALFLPPPPPPPPPAEGEQQAGFVPDPMPRLGNAKMGGGKGTLFLVRVASRNLLWSMTRQPKNSSPQEMIVQARKMVEQLRKDLAPPSDK